MTKTKRGVIIIGSMLFFTACMVFVLTAHAQNYTLQVNAGNFLRINTIIELELPQGSAKEYLASNLNKPAFKTIAQRTVSGKYIFILPDTIQPGAIHYYRLVPYKVANNTPLITALETDSVVSIFVKNKPVFQYQKVTQLPGADSPAYYGGSGFIHPLYSPSGSIITDGFPVGHPHQNGIFSAWTNTTFKGSHVDFWNRHQQKGKVEHVAVDNITGGATILQMESANRFVSVQHGTVLLESRVTTVYPFDQYFMFDIELKQTNVTDDTLYLNRYIYGGMAIRGNKAWNPDDKVHFKQPWNVLTSNGYRDSAANNIHASWVSSWGLVDGQQAGVTVFSHPSNFRHPQPIRVHPTMPYWVYAPPIDGEFIIAPGKTYKATYRYLSFTGEPDLALYQSMQAALRFPPVVQISYY